MNELVLMREGLLILSPLIFLQIGLAAYCGIKIFGEGVRNLNRWAWFLICVLVGVIGPVAFLLAGRREFQ